jgi:hypothetical protein
MPSTRNVSITTKAQAFSSADLKSGMGVLMEAWQKELAQTALRMAALPPSLLARTPRRPASGVVHSWPRMAHPACPWPYGTVIRPIGSALDNFSHDTRQMVLGVDQGREAIVAIPLNPYPTDWSDIDFYMHSLSNLAERWKATEEVPD